MGRTCRALLEKAGLQNNIPMTLIDDSSCATYCEL
jgi:hypothetical protein